VVGLGLVMAITAAAAPAAAQHIAVTDVEADPNLAAEAGALTLILRSYVGSRSRRVDRDKLAAAVSEVGGADGRLAVEPDKLGALSKALGGASIVTATLIQKGIDLEATVRVFSGSMAAQPPVAGRLAAFDELASAVVAAASNATGQLTTPRVKPAALAELAIVARAARALDQKDAAAAARILASCPPGLGLRVESVREITQTITGDASIPLDLRLAAALVGGDLNAARAAAEAAGDDPVARAGLARVGVASADDPAARKALDAIKRASDPFVVLARVARASEFGRADEVPGLFAPLIGGEPYVPALAMAARFRAKMLGRSERAMVAAAAGIRAEYPELATLIGTRALRGEQRTKAVFDLVDAYLLDSSGLRDLATDLAAAEADDGNAARLIAELGLLTGDVPTARSSFAKAEALLGADDPRLARTRKLLDGRAGETAAKPEKVDADAEPKMPVESLPMRPATERLRLLSEDLAPFLAELPIKADGVTRLVLAPLPGSEELPFWPRRVHPERLRDGLGGALASKEFRVYVVTDAVETSAKPTAKELATLAGDQDAQAALLYGIRTDGGAAKIRLVYYGVDSGQAVEGNFRLESAGEHDLVSLNPLFVAAVSTVGGLLLLWLVWGVVRGSGMVRVELKTDPAANKPSFSILISRNKKCPAVKDPKKHLASVSVEEKKRRFRADNVGANEEFERIPPGTWFVHVFGTYGKGGELRGLPPLTEPARVKRNQITTVTVDLVPKESEYHFLVIGERGPIHGAAVWLASDVSSKKITDAEGKAVMFIPPGEHAVHIKQGELELSQKIHAFGSRIANVTINVERERRLAQISGGLQVELEPDEDEPEIIPHRPEPAVSGLAATRAEISASGGAGGRGGDAETLRGLRRYQPEDELGRGAMGVVFRATDQVLGRKVALKVMSAELKEHPAAMQMFEQEAKALAALNHPNVVTVYDQGRDGDQMFMVMEYVEGKTLEDVLEARGKLTLEQAAWIGEQLGRGLAYAHGRRVIHRDIKPANIFLATDGTVKIGDFGLARVINEVSIKRTEVKGTPLYMAPEQIRGADIDFRADIYSVGCTLFEVLSGRPPFIEGEILYHHLYTEPPPLASLVQVPEAVDRLIMGCIAKDAGERVGSAERIAEVFASVR
jgi:predicted Ser/Thr protein kinase